MTLPLPLLVAPLQTKFGVIGYSFGWVLTFGDGSHFWTTWGNSKDAENAARVVWETLEKQGQREVLWWHEPLPRNARLTAEQLAEIRAAQPQGDGQQGGGQTP